MTKLEAIAQAKTFRKKADDLLQEMKGYKKQLMEAVRANPQLDKELSDSSEVFAQHTISIRDLESCGMRLGKVLQYIGTPDPYPESRNPASPVVAPMADGLKG